MSYILKANVKGGTADHLKGLTSFWMYFQLSVAADSAQLTVVNGWLALYHTVKSDALEKPRVRTSVPADGDMWELAVERTGKDTGPKLTFQDLRCQLVRETLYDNEFQKLVLFRFGDGERTNWLNAAGWTSTSPRPASNASRTRQLKKSLR